jgi:hypothetical protein
MRLSYSGILQKTPGGWRPSSAGVPEKQNNRFALNGNYQR